MGGGWWEVTDSMEVARARGGSVEVRSERVKARLDSRRGRREESREEGGYPGTGGEAKHSRDGLLKRREWDDIWWGY